MTGARREPGLPPASPASPPSLVRRITALVVGVTVMALLLNGALFFITLHHLGEDLVGKWSSQIHVIVSVLRQTPATQRDQSAAMMSVSAVTVSRHAPAGLDDPGSAPVERMPRGLYTALHQALGPGISLAETRGPNGQPWAYASTQIDRDVWWIGLPSPAPPTSQLVLTPLAMLALVALSAITAVLLGLRGITQPMSELAAQMRDRRSSLRPIEQPARVSIELQQIIHSFNDLVSALQQTAQTRRNLLAGVSHDLRTPLARLRLRAEFSGSDTLHAAMAEDIDAVARIVEQFLHYAQGDHLDLGARRQPLATVVRQVVRPYTDTGPPVQLGPMDDAETMAVPSLPLRRVLANLIDNALAHGQPPVEVSLQTVADGQVLWVRDHGAGLSPDDLVKAVQPFVKLRSADPASGHCGLGLAIVQQLSAKLGGELRVQAHDGQRSAIGVWLPHG
jgi:two-component system osmolarity sensor histidine kinase EnvZ